MPLRVALIAGCLSQGGAEKQFVYVVRALRQIGARVRVYQLTRGEFYEPCLQLAGVESHCIGISKFPVVRLTALAKDLHMFRPHVIQSSHFFANLYAAIGCKICNAVGIGSIRSSLAYELGTTGVWGRWLLHTPPALLTNSRAVIGDANSFGIRPERIHWLSNVLDLTRFDAEISNPAMEKSGDDHPKAIAVGRLVAFKRLDRFLDALALARREVPNLKGIIVGDGPERSKLEARRRKLGFSSEDVSFLGRRVDVPALLVKADMLVHCSDYEGSPNVLLEAMAARLPIVATPAGEARELIQDGTTGYMVSFEDIEGMARSMIRLATSPSLRTQFGDAARRRIEESYGFNGLAYSLLAVYREIARRLDNRRVLNALTPYFARIDRVGSTTIASGMTS